MKTTSKIKFFTRILFLSVFISFCMVSTLTAQKMTYNPKKTDNGLIFGSITFPEEKAKFNGYFLLISYKSTDPKIARKYSKEVHFSPAQITRMRHKGDLDNGLTYLFAVEKPEGEYAISNIRLFTNSGIALLQRTDNVNGFLIPFKVNKGEILYVGNIVFNENAVKMSDKDVKTLVTYQNNFEKDLAGIKKAEPFVYWDASKKDDSIQISYTE
ncbi:hypothetical protein J0383_01095 [Flavobacterium endoglycinae]|uniref:Uncharacterized protein n=1 Tax=Flavobacterium endoglycinae TaxID=2816357 RepID=A0ABX7QEQ3_9FLAO|nr:hypothetical protein [Flavobacterium endoglycinae]QSW89422.1 hypothetical protein J0383_01095 [Flavobacterium endoglycinae]